MKVLFVGQNPSKSNLDPKIPFVGTKSHKRLSSWAELLGLQKFAVVNASSKIGKVTLKDANPADILFAIRTYSPDHVVALGKYAHDVLYQMGIKHLALPHPSGLNRKLNDHEYLMKALVECREALI